MNEFFSETTFGMKKFSIQEQMYGHLTRLSLLQVVFWLSFSLGLQLRSEFLEYWTCHILLSRLIEILFSLTFGLVSFSFSTLAETWDKSFHNKEIFVFSKKKNPQKIPTLPTPCHVLHYALSSLLHQKYLFTSRRVIVQTLVLTHRCTLVIFFLIDGCW